MSIFNVAEFFKKGNLFVYIELKLNYAPTIYFCVDSINNCRHKQEVAARLSTWTV